MRIHTLDPKSEVVYPSAKTTRWNNDYGTRGFVARERPYIDDQPARRPGWEAGSRWGSRPVREFDRESGGGGITARGFFQLGWARIRNAFHVGARGELRSR